jgi:hypothetical protein
MGALDTYMPRLNLYVKDSDVEIIERWRKLVEKRGQSISEAIADIATAAVNSQTEPEEVKLEGFSATKIFKGHELYWEDEGNNQYGVFLTAKGKIVKWELVPTARDGDDEMFKIYDTLEEYFEEAHDAWRGTEKAWRARKQQIQGEYSRLTQKEIVERLDI